MRSIYLAARYSRKEELCHYRDQLQSIGYIVTSRWLDGTDEEADSTTDLNIQRTRAEIDTEDVLKADCLISFTEEPRAVKTRGGRHVEFGIALGSGKRLINVGFNENIFYASKQVEFFKTWEMCYIQLKNEVMPNTPEVDELKKRIVELEKFENTFKYLIAALHELVEDNLDLKNDKNNTEFVISKADVDEFFTRYGVLMNYDEDDNAIIEYIQKNTKQTNKFSKPKVAKGIY